MAEAKLIISRKDEQREVPLDPAGAVVGRGGDCDVVLESSRVSRRHARIFRDPFDRWIVEDLDSRNGVFVNGDRVEAGAFLPGDEVAIGPFRLELSEPQQAQIVAHPSAASSTAVVADRPGWAMAEEVSATEEPLSDSRLRELNRIIDRLAAAGRSSELYQDTCRCLATAGYAAALVVRMPASEHPLPPSPPILACHWQGSDSIAANGRAAPVHLSRRVLEAARSSMDVVRASNAGTSADQYSLTVGDDGAPRTVLCAPLSEPAGAVDVLYLDVPAASAEPDLGEFVRAVCRQVSLMRKSLLSAEIRADRQVLDGQLALAKEIQQHLTPAGVDAAAGVDVAVCYRPALWVGGDYCDVWPLPDGRLALAVGDVSGKGLPAAMVMSNLQAALRTAISFCPSLADAMAYVNEHLGRHLPTGMFVTLFVAAFDRASGELEYVNAGHLLPLAFHSPGRVHVVGEPANLPLGIERVQFRSASETIPQHAGFVAVSDGVTEAMSPKGRAFGSNRLARFLGAGRFSSATDLADSLVDLVDRFRQPLPQQDDITVFALLNRPASSSSSG